MRIICPIVVVQFNVEDYYFWKKIHDASEEKMAKEDPLYEIEPYHNLIEGDVEEEMRNRINKGIEKIESFSVKDMIGRD